MMDPPAVLAVLAQHPGRLLWVTQPPRGWIVPAHLQRLRELADSKAPAAVTYHQGAAHHVRRGTVSTVGRAARDMVKAADKEWAWGQSCSDMPE